MALYEVVYVIQYNYRGFRKQYYGGDFIIHNEYVDAHLAKYGYTDVCQLQLVTYGCYYIISINRHRLMVTVGRQGGKLPKLYPKQWEHWMKQDWKLLDVDMAWHYEH